MPTIDRTGANLAPHFLSLFRLIVGLMFFEHGLSKLVGFPHAAMFNHLTPLLIVAGVIELVGGALIALGLFTRIAAFIASGEMALAYFLVHAQHGPFPALNGGDAAILYCFVFFFFFLFGGGPWSLDRWLRGA